MYDPEGILATIPTVLSTWLGLHYRHVLKFEGLQSPKSTIAHWTILSGGLICIGIFLHIFGMPMNKQLWSASYLFFMAGTCGASLLLAYILVDIKHKG